MDSDFHIPSLRSSVKDLAQKTRQLKNIKQELKRLRRSGIAAPKVEHRNSESEIQLLDMEAVLEKLRTRSRCSRYHQLAYAFARQKPYRRAEQKTREGNAPHVTTLIEVLAPFFRGPQTVSLPFLRRLLQDWLAGIDTCLSFPGPQEAA